MRNFCPRCKSQNVGMHHKFDGKHHEYTVECYNCRHKTRTAPTFEEAVNEWDNEFEKR